MKKWLLIFLSIVMMLVLAVPALAETGTAYNAQGAAHSAYTVEFTYDGRQYVMPGDSTARLSEILDGIGLTGRVEAVEISDTSLFSASNETCEWIVTTHRAFSTTEWMKVTIGGVVYEITVTDDQIDGITVIKPTGGTVFCTLDKDIDLSTLTYYDSVHLSNKPDEGYRFVRYIVKDSSDNEISLTEFTDLSTSEKTYYFRKQPATVTAVFEPANLTITVKQPATGGTVSADKTAADEGDRVNLSYTEQSGYLLRNFVVTKASGGTVEVTNSSYVEGVYNWGFNMPAEAVTVTAVFAVVHAINVQQPNDGPINVASSAVQGDSVTIHIHPISGYTVKNLTVKMEGGKDVQVTWLTDHWSFTMPDSPVTVSVECEAKTYTVCFDKNAEDATGTMEPQGFIYGEAEKALTANAYTRKGYDFAGWNTLKAPGAWNAGEAYVDRQSVRNLGYDGTVTLYAQWTHTHSFSYALSDNRTITATCQKDVCPLTNKQATLTINAPTSLTYDGSEKSATITDDNSIQGAAKVQYQKKTGGSYGTVTETAPIDAGDYKASITLGNVTASVEYSIATPYPVWVGGVQVTSANKDDVLGNADEGATVMYTPANGSTPATLTLNGANIKNGSYTSATIYAKGDLTIDVTGDSTVTGPDATDSCGVHVEDGKVTITGSGTLTATGGKAETTTSCGVYAQVAVTVDVNGTLNAKGGTARNSIGVYAEEGAITVTGTLNAEGGTADYFSYGVYAYEGAITVNGTLNAEGGTANTSTGVYAEEGAITVTGTLTAAGNTRAIWGYVKNFIDGTGWTNTAGTEGKAYIAIKNDGQTLSYKKVQFLAHVHSFTYSANEATITATCTKTDGYCALPPSTEGGNDHIATLTIGAPALTTYGGTGSAEATITDAYYIQGDAKINYQKKTGESTYDTATETAPTDAGTYKASITLGEGNGAATASVEYTIEKADPAATAPIATATYGQTLADVTLTNPEGNTQGTWAWVDSTQSVGNVVSPAATFKANFTPSDTVNYNPVSDVDVAVTVSKADATTEMQAAAVSIQARNGETATVSYTLPAGASYGNVSNSNTDFFTVSKDNGLVLTAAKDWTESEWATDAPKTFTVPVTGATNYNNYTLTVSVTPTYHQHSFSYSANGATITATCSDTSCPLNSSSATLTIAAEGGTYDGTNAFSATVTNNIPAVEGDTVGEVEYYKVNTGNATTGGTKQDSAPINAGYYYASATLTSGGNSYTAVKAFTVAKADLGTPTVTMNGYTYGGTVSTPSIGTYSGGSTVTYYYNTADSASGGTAWENITATTLNANTYYMYAVIAESDNYNSYTTATASFTVSKAEQTAPAAPTKESATINSITLTAIENGEYKMGNGEWKDVPTFTELEMNTEYTFYQRLKEDSNHNASPESQSATLRTNDHAHEWSYEANGAIITATCGNSDGGHGTPLTATLTINAPTLTTYGETGKDANATITGSIEGVTNPHIVYRKGSETMDAVPTNAGTYTASITLGEGNDAATASVEYTIAKAAPIANAPTGLTATYGQTLADVTLTNPSGNTSGTWAWVDARTTSVGNAGSHTFKANFTPSDTTNYNTVSDVDVAMTVSKANARTEMQAAAVSIEAGNGKSATVSYTLPDGASYGDVLNSNTVFFTVSKDNGLVLTAAKNWTASEWATDAPKAFTIPVTGATNYNDYTLTVSVTPTYHQHRFSYSVSGETITATCEDESCDLHSSPATLTLSAVDAAYTGSAYTGASLSDTTIWTGAGLTAPTIEYEGRGDTSYTKSETAPTNAGTYTASITVATDKTATADFTISPKVLTITGATATDRAYDKDSTTVSISSVTFKDSSEQAVTLAPGEDKDYTVTGAMTDANAGDGKTVNVSVTLKNANYSLATSTTTATVNIGKAAAQTIADVTDSQVYTLTSISKSVADKMPADAGELTYTKGNASTTGSVTVSDFTVNATSGAVTATLSGGAAGDTVTLPITISSTNYADSSVNVKITLTAKGTQNIDAADVTATYGDTDKKISATTDGDGAISYAVKDGSADYIDVNASTGALTIKKVPADGKAYVVVTAAGTAAYEQATKDVTVMINKANAVPAAVTANNRTYDGTEKPLMTVTGEATGGTMQYALGTATEATEPYTTSIPTATNAGTYCVWYYVKGDEKHVDTEPECIEVTISSYAYISGDGSTWTKNSVLPLIFRIRNSVNDSKTAENFTGIQVDGKPVPKEQYKAYSGSVIIELKPAYLETLSAGEHKLTAGFTDGTTDAKFTILASEVVNLPQTGDGSNVSGHMFAGLIALAGLGLLMKKRS